MVTLNALRDMEVVRSIEAYQSLIQSTFPKSWLTADVRILYNSEGNQIAHGITKRHEFGLYYKGSCVGRVTIDRIRLNGIAGTTDRIIVAYVELATKPQEGLATISEEEYSLISKKEILHNKAVLETINLFKVIQDYYKIEPEEVSKRMKTALIFSDEVCALLK